MWWLGCTGIWLKSEVAPTFALISGAALANKVTVTVNETGSPDAAHGWREKTAANLRTTPFVLDPFAIRQIDAVRRLTITTIISTLTSLLP